MARSRVALLSLLALAATCSVSAARASAHPGDLDPTFSHDGYAQAGYLNDGRGTVYPPGLAQDPFGETPDGDILVGGERTYVDGCGHLGCSYTEVHAAVARFRPDGHLDPDFGNGGVIESTLGVTPGGFGGGLGQPSFALAPDGAIVIAATATPPGGGVQGIVARLLPNGQADPSFGDGGTQHLDFLNQVLVKDVAVDPMGRILVAGQIQGAPLGEYQYDHDDFVARLLPDGSPDPGFGGGDGVATVNLSLNDATDRIALDSQGRILGVADSFNFQAYTADLALFRLLDDGSPDKSFGTDGATHIDPRPDTGSNATPTALAIDGQDRPVVSTEVSLENGGPSEPAALRYLVRFTSDGTPDDRFGTHGVARVAIPGESSLSPSAYSLDSILIAPDGRIVVAGGALVGRVNADGTPDSTFGQDGWTRLHPSVPSVFSGLQLDPAGQIIVGGATYEPHFRAQIARLRVDPGGVPDADADGIGDSQDECVYLFGAAGGCPSYGRDVTLDAHQPNLLEGWVSSRSTDCVEGTVVRLFAKVPGRDRRLGKPSNPIEEVLPADAGERTTDYWALKGPRYKGRVYARVKRTHNPEEGDCGAARSRVLSLR
jgi:uncharacterized delta-60 repeat protein